ncbi:hypothetical protein TUM4438_42440 [Shewanella sairae]|uniref:DUF4391 domain-containing protein n=1 Tax=Shewanella sairae TaxID=190310 RepID=A0ABQ4PQW8_9GAMM|nr:DUF4391 domain-containing protein [Shewanella sairae]GIU51739.1 hypothetical protein TUM4438_42440 [Shewanella sairae]
MTPLQVAKLKGPKVNFQLFTFPGSCALGSDKNGQKLPKETIYQQAQPTTIVKQLFVKQIEQIIWRYKLSSDTLNLAAHEDVTEIQVFDIYLKPDVPKPDQQIFETLDKAIPSPLLYRVFDSNNSRPKIKYVMAYKRHNKRDTETMVVEQYFQSNWVASTPDKACSLPIVLDIKGLYTALIRNLITEPALENESFQDQLSRIGQIQVLSAKLEKLQTRLRKEKQFNRKVELNKQANQLKNQITSLKSHDAKLEQKNDSIC